MLGVLGFLRMRVIRMRAVSTVRLNLLGAIRPLKFVALAGNRKPGNKHK